MPIYVKGNVMRQLFNVPGKVSPMPLRCIFPVLLNFFQTHQQYSLGENLSSIISKYGKRQLQDTKLSNLTGSA